MIELKTFQTKAAQVISDRYAFYSRHQNRPRRGNTPRPFFQAISALTGAGKTPILAHAVALIRAQLSIEPIVFWMSKARPVIAQTHQNFQGTGKYADLIPDFNVIRVGDLSPELITDGTSPLLITTTTGLFNDRDQAEGSRNIYKRDNDLFGNQSPWERLIERKFDGKRRPLIVVYDEGHNLSEQQTEIISELEPEAYLLASATLKLPANFHKTVISPLQLWAEQDVSELDQLKQLGAVDEEGNPDARLFITTQVVSSKVVEAQLVKRALQFDGTTAAMETSIDRLVERLELLESEIDLRNLGFSPKAIYVCRTNITADGEQDDTGKPFSQRQAPPIRIWRYLVDEKGIDPQRIAIYADLKFVDGTKPPSVNLFSKGETDFEDFRAGNFQHIIFNLSLQEGWDDPACYLAYIDKSMGSSIQVEQVIGRVLRQYGATHYETPLLNSAHFFVRVDKESVFVDAINSVKKKLMADGTPIAITGMFSGKDSHADDIGPREGMNVLLHPVFVNSDAAMEKVNEIIDDFPTLQEGGPDTIGEARTATEIIDLTKIEPGPVGNEWQNLGHTNAVRLRWLVSTALKSRSAEAFSLVNLTSEKFDVRVQLYSRAQRNAQDLSEDVARAFYDLAELSCESLQNFVFGKIRVPRNAPSFQHSLYERYHGMNQFELDFAYALDAHEAVWHRNPSIGGYRIPLLIEGETNYFYPDFIVWQKNAVFCIDTKGNHLLTDAVTRKLFNIREDGKTRVYVRFVSEGKQDQLRAKPTPGGFTVWRAKNGVPQPVAVDSISKSVKESLRPS